MSKDLEMRIRELEMRADLVEKQVNPNIVVKVEVMEGAKLPFYANKGDAGMDLIANKDLEIPVGESRIVPTGIKVAIPEGYELQVRARSGISAKTTLIVANSPGTVDSGYLGEVGVILFNNGLWNTRIKDIKNQDVESLTEHAFHEKGRYVIRKGDRVAQIVLNKIAKIDWEVVEDINKVVKSERGEGGFGSTGVK